MVPRRVAFSGSTFETTNRSSRWPSMASASICSTAPLPYISAVSTCVSPSSIPRLSAAIAERLVVDDGALRGPDLEREAGADAQCLVLGLAEHQRLSVLHLDERVVPDLALGVAVEGGVVEHGAVLPDVHEGRALVLRGAPE